MLTRQFVIRTAAFQHQTLQIHVPKMADSSPSCLSLCYVVAMATVRHRSGCSSLFSTSSLLICAVAIIGSAQGLAELNDLQEDKHIQPLVKPGNTQGDTYARNMAESSREYPTHKHKRLSQT